MHIPIARPSIKPASRRRLFAEFTRDKVGRELRTNFILAGDFLVGHPDEKAISGAISWWRAGAARNSDKVCFGCRAAFGIGRAVPGAFSDRDWRQRF